MSEPRYPQIEVQLSGEDVNGFHIMGKVRGALKRAGVSPEERKEFGDEAMSGDYDDLLETCARWVTVAWICSVVKYPVRS